MTTTETAGTPETLGVPETLGAPVPTAPKDRIAALDLIRGLAILGILAVNADGFAAPLSAYGSTAMFPFPNEGWTAVSKWIVDAFFHEKFITLFSMLFGVSLFLVGGEFKDRVRGPLVWRRVGWLFVIAMVHGFLIWWGDVLSLYALCGTIMLFCRSWRPRRLMVVGVILFAVMGALQLSAATINLAPPEKRAEILASVVPSPAKVAERKAVVAREIAEATASWGGALAVNARTYVKLMQIEVTFALPATLGLMMVGLSLFKTGFLAGRSSVRRYGVVIAAGTLSLGVVGWLAWQADVADVLILGGDGVNVLLTPLIALAYASILILIWRTGLRGLLKPLARAGQMTFTNYLTQSLIMTTIFYGGRGALMGQVDRPGLWAIVIAVWVVQLIWSSLWLSRFQMGPLEWVWRSLTYGRPVRFMKPA